MNRVEEAARKLREAARDFGVHIHDPVTDPRDSTFERYTRLLEQAAIRYTDARRNLGK